MKKIRFYNNGILNEESFKMMGVSVKSDDTKIGKFGTGLKYAIAGILRTGGNISIKTRSKNSNEVFTYVFTTKEKEIRGKQFNIVCCNGEQLSYATDYGHHWEAWQWFRELQSNALDEEGDSTNEPVSHFDTIITVNHPEIYSCWKKRDEYFLNENTPVIETINGNQILDCDKGKIFCKGVFVGETEMLLSINFDDALLTEDRTIDSPSVQIGRLLVQSENEKIINLALTSNSPNFHGVWGNDPVSERFLDIVESGIVNARSLPLSVISIHNQRRGEVKRPSFTPTKFQESKLNKALEFLDSAGITVSQSIKFVKTHEGDSLFGYVKDGEIFLTEKAFEHGVHDLVQTVLEEYYHCETGHRDNTREFQQFLFRKIVEQMEIATNNPL